jgi:hypothetical protein
MRIVVYCHYVEITPGKPLMLSKTQIDKYFDYQAKIWKTELNEILTAAT